MSSSLSGGAQQEQSVRQRVLRGRQGVRREREGRAQLPVHRGENLQTAAEEIVVVVFFKLCTLWLLFCCFFALRAASPTRGQCAAATARLTGTTVSSTGTLVWRDWRSRWPMMDTARVRAAATPVAKKTLQSFHLFLDRVFHRS